MQNETTGNEGGKTIGSILAFRFPSNISLNVSIVLDIISGHFEGEDLHPKQHGHVQLSLAWAFAIF